jgi:SAM-dependent methyltransferase
MRFLVLLRGVAQMTGVDATAAVIQLGRQRCVQHGVADCIDFRLADATETGLESGVADFVWGEDAWCYVDDKPRLIEEAVRLIRAGGTIAFTDWIVGPEGLPDDAAKRFFDFMKFPDMQSIAGYRAMLEQHGCEVVAAEDTGRFAPCVDLYVAVTGKQFGYDVLRILGFDMAVAGKVGAELLFVQELAHAGCIGQGMFVARKPS